MIIQPNRAGRNRRQDVEPRRLSVLWVLMGAILGMLAGGPSFAQTTVPTYYVSPTGSDTHDGRTVGTAFRTITKAAAVVGPGDRVWIRGGTYRENVNIQASGTETAPITFEAYPGERPAMDGSGLQTDFARAWTQPAVLSIGGRFVTVRGLEIRNAASTGVMVWPGGADSILDSLHVHHTYAAAIFLYLTWNVSVLDSVVHDAFDFASGGSDADCIGAGGYEAHGRHLIRGNMVYNCADDGIDLWTSANNVVEHNVVHHSGMGWRGNGNGYKLGPGGGNIVRRNVAYDNRASGFTSNEGGNNRIYGNTAYRNQLYNFANWSRRNAYKNNLSADGPVLMDLAAHRNNSWNLNIADPRFVSIDPDSPDFLRLHAGSPVIDKGLWGVGEEPFSGTGPDLGAYEFEDPPQADPPAAAGCLPFPLPTDSLVSDGGLAYLLVKTFGIPADGLSNPAQSRLRVFESGVEIGPAHAVHQDIRLVGRGRFSHWNPNGRTGEESLRFSSSDDTDPRTNGRAYSYCLGGSGAPMTQAGLP